MKQDDPNTMTHDMLIALRDEEWFDDPSDPAIMRDLCATMRKSSPEEYRCFLLIRKKNADAGHK